MRKILFSIAAVPLLLGLAACKWQIPQSVAVKTNATYNLTVGTVEKDLGQYLDISKTIGSTYNSDSRIKIYDYNPEKASDDLQQYAVRMPIQEIPIDFTSYFNTTSVADLLTGISFSKDLTIPDVNLNFENSIGLSQINDTINAMLSFTGVTPGGEIDFVGNFKSVTYNSGYMLVSETSGDISGSVELNYNGTLVSEAVFSDGIAKIPLEGKTVYKSGMTLNFTDNSGAGFVGIISGGEIKTGNGVTSSSPIAVPVTATVTRTGDASAFESCVIGTGALITDINIPESWTNLSLSYSLVTTGALELTDGNTSGGSKNIDLSGKTILNDDTNVTSSVSVSLNDATVVFADIPTLSIKTTITKIASATVRVSDLSTSQSQTSALSSEITSLVETLALGQCGLKGTYTNTLPAGNDITLEATSDFLGLAAKQQAITAATESGTISLLSDERTVKLVESPSAADEFNSIDFRVDVRMPGYISSDPDLITVVNVEPEATYTLGLNIQPEFNWTSVTLNTSSMSKAGYLETGIDFASICGTFNQSLGNVFDNKISFNTIPVYLYCEKPDLSALASAKFHGDIRAFYSDGTLDSGTQRPVPDSRYEILDFLKDADMGFANIPESVMDGDVLITDFSKYDASMKGDFKSLINSTVDEETGSLYVDYDLTFSNSSVGDATFTITYDDFQNCSSSATSITIYAIVVIPLQFNLSDDVTIDIFDLTNVKNDSDILKRSGPTDYSSIKKYLDLITNISFVYKIEKSPFHSDNPLKFTLDMYNAQGTGEPVELLFTEGTYDIDIEEFLSAYPLIPAINFILPTGDFSITRNLAMGVNASVRIDAKGQIDLIGGDE